MCKQCGWLLKRLAVLQVVNVPGDHFSLLRQSEEDMQTIVNTLKLVLSPFGWQTTSMRDHKLYKRDDVSSSLLSVCSNSLHTEDASLTDFDNESPVCYA